MGRFLNADELVSTGQGVLGNNMFAYCLNNPVNYADSYGTSCHSKEYNSFYVQVQPVESKNIPSTIQEFVIGTLSLGVAGSIGVGPWAWGGQICITIDANGYVAMQYGYSGGISADPTPAGFSASCTPYFLISNAPSFDTLEGPGIQIGGSKTPYVIDYNLMLDRSGQNVLYQGLSIGYGATTPGVHVMWGETYSLFSVKFDWDIYHSVTQY